jgi:hypothetical protein
LEQLGKQMNTRIVLRWSPAHSGVPGNEQAHQLAQQATAHELDNAPTTKVKSVALAECTQPREETRRRFLNDTRGHYSKELDHALPGKHTRQIYDDLERESAQIVSQLRTGKCRLNGYLASINASVSDICEECQRAETVRHFLVECSRWSAERQQHLQPATERWSDVSYILGGWFNERLDGPRDKWKANTTVLRAVIEYVKATGRLRLGTEDAPPAATANTESTTR